VPERDWTDYFATEAPSTFDKIGTYALARLALFVAKRHKKPRSYG
jgi:hypothetical protein